MELKERRKKTKMRTGPPRTGRGTEGGGIKYECQEEPQGDKPHNEADACGFLL